TVNLPLPATMQALHEALRGTRGAAVGLALVEPRPRSVRFVGIGNVAGTIIARDSSTRSLVSHAGIVGGELHRVQEFQYPWSRGATLVLASDGLGTRWDIRTYPGLALENPAVLAATLFRDHVRNRDDVTVLSLAESSGGAPP